MEYVLVKIHSEMRGSCILHGRFHVALERDENSIVIRTLFFYYVSKKFFVCAKNVSRESDESCRKMLYSVSALFEKCVQLRTIYYFLEYSTILLSLFRVLSLFLLGYFAISQRYCYARLFKAENSPILLAISRPSLQR